MAKYITDPANDEPIAGKLFNYEVWDADTELTLTNVPWNNDYRDVVWYDSTNDLNEYIDAHGDITQISNALYAKANEPITISTPFNVASQFNYIRAYNPAQPIQGIDIPKYFYYFITGVRYVAPNTTELIVQLDIWQTYIRLVQFGRCFIERGHIGIANQDNFRSYGREFLTVPEGIDTGSEYVVVASKAERLMHKLDGGSSVLGISTINLSGPSGDKYNPDFESARGGWIQGNLPTGASAYIWDTPSALQAFMASFASKPWITAGIISLTLIPSVRRFMPAGTSMGAQDAATKAYPAQQAYMRMKRKLFTNWRNSTDISEYIPVRYRHLKKFYTYPYMAIELTTWTGSPVLLKPESWNSADAAVLEGMSIAPPNPRLQIIPLGYNGRSPVDSSEFGWTKDGEYADIALYVSDFPKIPLVNNQALLALAQNARSISQQYTSASWSQQRALRGNATSYDQASAGMEATQKYAQTAISHDLQSTRVGNQLAQDTALLSGLGALGTGAGMGAFAGPAGAVVGAVGGGASGIMGALTVGQQVSAANDQFAIRNSQNIQNTATNTGLAGYVRDTNRSLADWASKGDYENVVAGLNAKVQDMSMIQPSVVGQFGGETMNFLHDDMEINARWKMIDQASISVIGEYWLRYGYSVMRRMQLPNNLMVMSKFSYWKMAEVYIRNARMPELFKQALRGVLEKGVTVWASADDIGVIDSAENVPLAGIVIDGYVPPPWEPEEPPLPPVKVLNKRNKKMLVYTTNDGVQPTPVIYALAGTSPGTDANWIETREATLASSFLEACQVENPVPLATADFYAFKAQYLSPVTTAEVPTVPEP